MVVQAQLGFLFALVAGHEMTEARQDRLERWNPRRASVANPIRKMQHVYTVQIKIFELIIEVKRVDEGFAHHPINF